MPLYYEHGAPFAYYGYLGNMSRELEVWVGVCGGLLISVAPWLLTVLRGFYYHAGDVWSWREKLGGEFMSWSWSEVLVMLGAAAGTVGALVMVKVGYKELEEGGKVREARSVLIGAVGVWLGFMVPTLVWMYDAWGGLAVVGAVVWGVVLWAAWFGLSRLLGKRQT